MQKMVIEANIVDIIQKKIYPARISFDTHIRKIELFRANSCNSWTPKIPEKYIIPGLVDAHVHIESSMLPPSEFARIAVRHGTLAAVSDPHEIANVLGLEGIDFMIADSAHIPFKFIFGAPSCVPATSFETAGAHITADDIDKLFKSGIVSYLSEMMNFPGVLFRDPEVMAKIAVAQKYGKPVDGHAPGLTGEELRKYVEAGITTDHECSSFAEAEEKILSGMKILIREGSAAKNFNALCYLIEKYPDSVMLCSDDLHPDDLLKGHINKLLAKGIENQLDLFSLLRAATLNPVKHYQIDLGLVQTGDSADFIIVDNLKDFTVQQTYLRGACVYDRVGEEARKLYSSETTFPNYFNASKITAEDLSIVATSEKMKVIQAFDSELLTKQIVYDVQKDAIVKTDTDADILKMVVVNRYQPAKPAVAFVRGFGLKQGALVSTVAHDSHHIVAVGCDDDSLVQAINHIIDLKGGLTACYQNSLIDLKLDIAGLMSSSSGEEVGKAYEQLNSIASRMGCLLNSPFMTLSFMALLVIPELKLGEKGLFDVQKFNWTDMFREQLKVES